jgi:hypothetical protein
VRLVNAVHPAVDALGTHSLKRLNAHGVHAVAFNFVYPALHAHAVVEYVSALAGTAVHVVPVM